MKWLASLGHQVLKMFLFIFFGKHPIKSNSFQGDWS
jgi:hypothetical protein